MSLEDRINEALEGSEWPQEWRTVFIGNVLVQEVVYSEDQAKAVRDAADAEFPKTTDA